MDILKHAFAPITERAWQEIEKEAKSVLKSNLSARKFVKVTGPKGFDFTAIGLGRLKVPETQPENGVKYGIHQVQPLVEIRVPFELNIWEMDNIERGAKDIDLSHVADAAKKAAYFEDQAIFYGFEPGNITGLEKSGKYEQIDLKLETTGMFEGISKAIVTLKNEAVEGPYFMVAGNKVWQEMNKCLNGYPLRKLVEKLIEGPVIYSNVIDNAYLLPSASDALELTIGQDFSIGYEVHTSKTVRLFLTESFTFRVLDPRCVFSFKIL